MLPRHSPLCLDKSCHCHFVSDKRHFLPPGAADKNICKRKVDCTLQGLKMRNNPLWPGIHMFIHRKQNALMHRNSTFADPPGDGKQPLGTFCGWLHKKLRDRSHNDVSQKLSFLIRSSAQTCKRWWLQTLFSSLRFLLQRWLRVSESCWNMIFVKLWGTHSLTTADNADSVQQAENSIYNADCQLKDCPQFTEQGEKKLRSLSVHWFLGPHNYSDLFSVSIILIYDLTFSFSPHIHLTWSKTDIQSFTLSLCCFTNGWKNTITQVSTIPSWSCLYSYRTTDGQPYQSTHTVNYRSRYYYQCLYLTMKNCIFK